MHPLGGKKLARDGQVFGGHAQARALAHRKGVVKVSPYRHANAAA